jgi:hypothetical protein
VRFKGKNATVTAALRSGLGVACECAEACYGHARNRRRSKKDIFLAAADRKIRVRVTIAEAAGPGLQPVAGHITTAVRLAPRRPCACGGGCGQWHSSYLPLFATQPRPSSRALRAGTSAKVIAAELGFSRSYISTKQAPARAEADSGSRPRVPSRGGQPAGSHGPRAESEDRPGRRSGPAHRRCAR